jgi:exopolysaccharide biosynthesis polyprenyl glycosylphosphotransferase
MLAIVALAASFPRIHPISALIASAGFLLFGLVALQPVVRTWVRQRDNLEGTLFLGSAERARRFWEEIAGGRGSFTAHVVDCEEIEQVRNLCEPGTAVSNIVVADTASLSLRDDIASALIGHKLRGVRIETTFDSFERLAQKIRLDGLSPKRLLLANGFQPSKVYMAAKRTCDVVLSATLLIAAAPVGLILAAAIRLDSRGPAIFRQERVGLRGRNFTLYKFRSMNHNAECNGPVWAKRDDSRITRFGRWMRRTRLDELPQLVNVLRGDMSLVGPRPERPYFVEMLKSRIRFYDLRHYVKPGITGWAQVMYAYGASVEDACEKLQYDLYYAKNVSLRLDISILLKTVKVVVNGQGR